MASIRITSTEAPFDSRRVARLAVAVISVADAMGLLDDLSIERLDLPSFREVVHRIASAGIGTEVEAALAAPQGAMPPAEIGELLGRLVTAMEESPAPDHEWRSLEELFGTDRLAALLGVSPASVRRYRAGLRGTPDALASRLHYLATLIGDLAGAYNEVGIRRWFERPRTVLDGAAPADLLAADWQPEDPGPRRLRELARSLTGSPAT